MATFELISSIGKYIHTASMEMLFVQNILNGGVTPQTDSEVLPQAAKKMMANVIQLFKPAEVMPHEFEVPGDPRIESYAAYPHLYHELLLRK